MPEQQVVESALPFFLLAMALVYFVGMLLLTALPAFIAWKGNHPHFPAILVISLFLGWTLIGWVVALAWAMTPPRRQ